MITQPWDIQQQNHLAKMAGKEDAARVAADRVRLVVDIGFTVQGLDEHPLDLAVQPGDYSEISAHDLQKYLGKAHVPLPGMERTGEQSGYIEEIEHG